MLFLTSAAANKLYFKIHGRKLEVSETLSFSAGENSRRKTKNHFFRIKIIGGGCSGYQYKFSIGDSFVDNDIFLVTHDSELELVVDKHSLPLLEGATIDHSSSIAGEHFFVKNPNAKSNCGCGSSFST